MTSASIERLREHVCRIEGERHPQSSPEALKAAARYIRGSFEGFGLEAGADSFAFRGASYDNIVAVKEGEDPSAPRVLIGAHHEGLTHMGDVEQTGFRASMERLLQDP